MTATELTPASAALFGSLARDAGNWAGEPMFDGGPAEKGNLTHLKKLGLVETFVDGGCAFVIFTDAGREFAAENGITITG